jgi:hypothetical protein
MAARVLRRGFPIPSSNLEIKDAWFRTHVRQADLTRSGANPNANVKKLRGSEAVRRLLRSHPESKIEWVLSLVPKGAHGIDACGSHCGDQAGGNRNEQ